jgi:hypothetical protein
LFSLTTRLVAHGNHIDLLDHECVPGIRLNRSLNQQRTTKRALSNLANQSILWSKRGVDRFPRHDEKVVRKGRTL